MQYLFDRIDLELQQRLESIGDFEDTWLLADFGFSRLQISNRISLLDCPLPVLEAGSVQGVVVNLQLAWFDYQAVFEWCRTLLAPGGRLLFATLGPDTLFQLRQAWQIVDESPHVHPFVDLHLLGDQLVSSGFEKPILDADWFGVEYEDIDLVMDDLRRQGFHNVLTGRRKTLMAGSRVEKLRREFAGGQPVQMTFELIYGYARCPYPTGGIRVNPPA